MGAVAADSVGAVDIVGVTTLGDAGTDMREVLAGAAVANALDAVAAEVGSLPVWGAL